MPVLIISDVHSNLAALTAVLADAGRFDMIWSLGDIVGYGPEPNACIALLREHEHVAVPGNHDWGVLGRLDLKDFNHDARLANLWTRDQLTAESRAYLEALPEKRVEGGFTLAHGSPREPIWEYLLHPEVIKASFASFDTAVCLVGHTHVPAAYMDMEDETQLGQIPVMENEEVLLDSGRYIVNPGSVGQPRDADPRAAYALLDTDTRKLQPRRVEYDIGATQEKMRAAKLPYRNIARLAIGW